jgi:hypothetical protein
VNIQPNTPTDFKKSYPARPAFGSFSGQQDTANYK